MWVVKCDFQDEPQMQLRQVYEVLRFLLLAKVCYHTAMERHFDWETSGIKQECVHHCSRCLRDTEKPTKWVNMQGVMPLLLRRVHGSDKDVTLRDLVRNMKESRKNYVLLQRGRVVAGSWANTCTVSAVDCCRYYLSCGNRSIKNIGTDKMSSLLVAVT